MLNIVIPMAGAGRRFAEAGYAEPKPLIPIHGLPMIALVAANLRPARPHRFVFVCQAAHVAAFDLRARLAEWAPGCAVVTVDGMTEGAACTVLAARDLIDGAAPLMLANSDQFVDVAIDEFLAAADQDDALDGLIMTMTADDPKWSYAAPGPDGLVREVAEKRVISPHATVGVYHFARGGDFVRSAEAMIAADERVNGEFYVAPVYNRLIAAGGRVGIWDTGPVGTVMHGLGTPEDMEAFVARPVSRRAAGR